MIVPKSLTRKHTSDSTGLTKLEENTRTTVRCFRENLACETTSLLGLAGGKNAAARGARCNLAAPAPPKAKLVAPGLEPPIRQRDAAERRGHCTIQLYCRHLSHAAASM